jgi:hypothetical protein
VSRGTLFQDRDYPVLNDYRAVLGGLFRSMWGLSGDQNALHGCNLRGLDLREFDLANIDLSDCYFRQADLQRPRPAQLPTAGSKPACRTRFGTYFPVELAPAEIEMSVRLLALSQRHGAKCVKQSRRASERATSDSVGCPNH